MASAALRWSPRSRDFPAAQVATAAAWAASSYPVLARTRDVRVGGLVLVLVILFQPDGLDGMWLKVKRWFQTFPFKRQTSFRRQSSW